MSIGTQRVALAAVESRRLAEYLPGPQRPTILKGRTRSRQRRRLADASLCLLAVEDDMEIAFCAEESPILEEASVKMPMGKVKDLLPSPTSTQRFLCPHSEKSLNVPTWLS